MAEVVQVEEEKEEEEEEEEEEKSYKEEEEEEQIDKEGEREGQGARGSVRERCKSMDDLLRRCARRKHQISSGFSLMSEIPLSTLPRTLRRSLKCCRLGVSEPLFSYLIAHASAELGVVFRTGTNGTMRLVVVYSCST